MKEEHTVTLDLLYCNVVVKEEDFTIDFLTTLKNILLKQQCYADAGKVRHYIKHLEEINYLLA